MSARLAAIVVGQIDRRDAVELLHQVIALGDDDVAVPVLLLERRRRCPSPRPFRRRPAACPRGHHDLLPALGEHAAPLLFVQRAGPLACRVEIGLVAADDPLAHFLAAILNAAVAADNLELGPQLEVADFALAPDEKRVPLGRLLGRRLAGDDAVLDAPEFGIAVPAVERLAVKQAAQSRFRHRRRALRPATRASDVTSNTNSDSIRPFIAWSSSERERLRHDHV